MSYVTIFQVMANGDVLEVGEGSNNHTFAPLVWNYLGKKYGYGDDVMAYGKREDLKRMWKEWPSPKMTRLEHILLGATFDHVWIPRELLPELIEACELFYKEYIAPVRMERNWKGVLEPQSYDSRTLMGDEFANPPGTEYHNKHYGRKGIIPCLKEILEDPTSRGVAFNCCSAVSDFWSVSCQMSRGNDEVEHVSNEDCAPHIVDGECTICGVEHNTPCDECGLKGFHNQACGYYEWDSRPWNVDRDVTQPRGEYEGKRAYNLAEDLAEGLKESES